MAGSNGRNGTGRLSLDQLSDDAGELEIEGQWRRVVQLDGPGWEAYDRFRELRAKVAAGESPSDSISTEEFYGLAERCLPDTPKDVVRRLTAQKANIVIQVAANTLEAVEASIPKVEEPAEGETLTPSSA